MPTHQHLIQRMIDRGTRMPVPETVTIGPDVDPERVSGRGVTIHAGCRILGAKTWIGDGAELGYEAPVTVKDCCIGPHVQLKGGFFENAVFLEGAQAGSGAHVRAGTILEEQAGIAHTVGLKQTILFPFVTLGSLINFCDCLMAGGTSSRNHSEVGSSYIHFNFTPNQDKATPSLIGDVPHGVMLNQRPIFLGGQGGLVGPCRIAYGTVVAAGSIYRKDQLQPDQLIFEGEGRGGSIPYVPGIFRQVKRQAVNNIIYIANLAALMVWYSQVRCRFVGDRFPLTLYQGLIETLEAAILERVNQFSAFCEKLKDSNHRPRRQESDGASSRVTLQKDQLYHHRHQVGPVIDAVVRGTERYANAAFMALIAKKVDAVGPVYLDVIRSLSAEEAGQGTAWLQQVVDQLTAQLLKQFPALGPTGPDCE